MSSGDSSNVADGEEVIRGDASASLRPVEPSPAASASPIAGNARRVASRRFGLKPAEWVTMLAASALVLGASHLGLWPITITEGWGFVTGGVCVWLVVREHLWNWPVGLANNAFFFVLFLHGRLYADMGLQVIYFGLGVYGWLNWILGGENRTALRISRTIRAEWLALGIAIPLATWVLREILVAVNGAAPLWDSLTTVLSLAAQYLLCRKRLENWWFWIAADLIYIPLYLSRHLPLTAILYAVLLGMCLIGVSQWWRTWGPGDRNS